VAVGQCVSGLPLGGMDGSGRKLRNCILVWLDGGASHLETFDPKPLMPAEVRGPLASIATAIAGVRFGECLPGLAQRLDRMTLLRGLTSPLGEHNLGAHYLLTGHLPTPVLEYPALGSVVAFHERDPGDLPAHVAIPNHRLGGTSARAEGFLPAGFAPLEVAAGAKAGGSPGLDMAGSISEIQVARRAEFVRQLDAFSRQLDLAGSAGGDATLDQAVRMLTSPPARKAFDLEAEPANVRARFGPSEIGQSCLLARRLIEAGVRFVTVHSSGWDTHDNLVTRLKDGYTGAQDPVGLVPNLDKAVSALFDDLQSRGLLDETLVVVMGEFGRTPKINPQGGRDHWPRAFSALLAGGGTPAGLVHGVTDAAGESPVDGAVSPADLVATIYHLLGLDPRAELMTPGGRPIRLAGDGQIIPAIAG
jgi:Protein of unknown function (DUF1501)